ncbi:metallopeptidase family protein [Eggerthella timonensis]|uniref:metallopeptidase family protein n=1 Tax=Eggerthella timonensis TaxID=1871008 RepID=UPI000C7746AA|nr:metallopeptidase family protein [Eggerthella timonensis]
MHRMTDSEFESAVEEALERIPERFLDALENVAVVVEDEPNDYHLDALDDPDCLGASMVDDELLGLYDGVSLPDRADGYDGDIPDVITVFKGPHERCFGSREEVVEEIGKTVVHEIGHYFGIDDARLHEMGY